MGCMTAFGVGEIMGALLLGKIVDKFHNKLGILFNLFLSAITFTLWIIYAIKVSYNKK